MDVDRLNDALSARFGSLEFVLQQLYALRLRDVGDPLEGALAVQAMAMTVLKRDLEAMPEGRVKEVNKEAATHVHGFFEKLVQHFENE